VPWAFGGGDKSKKIKFSDPPFVRQPGDFPANSGTENIA
jgi:hypothetical protein